ncbi:hypothetical protein CLOSTMETH_00602 [[Clostridium] methylpentosum DSM 5476]|uniref:Uncharacterized protein n=1 Tax=[Clostridium] methylpentosum DSM 5476 TaxID=537013 RepID=C0E9V1_9FIRM|nr:hypothetical protein CLOSTMETH_00602 [[Clostridium] methylpentosum DSM 5476]
MYPPFDSRYLHLLYYCFAPSAVVFCKIFKPFPSFNLFYLATLRGVGYN